MAAKRLDPALLKPHVRAVVKEIKRARRKLPRYQSAHEAIAILEEEFLELRAEVYKRHSKRDYAKMEAEACQVATVAILFMMDICGDD